MLDVLDVVVKYIYSVILSMAALIALMLVPPIGMIMLMGLSQFLKHEAGNDA